MMPGTMFRTSHSLFCRILTRKLLNCHQKSHTLCPTLRNMLMRLWVYWKAPTTMQTRQNLRFSVCCHIFHLLIFTLNAFSLLENRLFMAPLQRSGCLAETLSTLTVIRREVIFPPFTHWHDGHHKLQFYAIYEWCFQVGAIECRFPAGHATTEFCCHRIFKAKNWTSRKWPLPFLEFGWNCVRLWVDGKLELLNLCWIINFALLFTSKVAISQNHKHMQTSCLHSSGPFIFREFVFNSSSLAQTHNVPFINLCRFLCATHWPLNCP